MTRTCRICGEDVPSGAVYVEGGMCWPCHERRGKGSPLDTIQNLRAELKGVTHERDVAREACENLTAMRDAAVRELDEAVAVLRRVATDPETNPIEAYPGFEGVVREAARAFLALHDAKAGAR